MVRFLLLFLSLLTAFGFPQGAGAQGVFEFEPDTLFYTDSGEVVMTNVSPDTVVLDSMTMRWQFPDNSVHAWDVAAIGQPTAGQEEHYGFIAGFEETYTNTVDLAFAPKDTLHLTFGIDPCLPCLSPGGGVADTLVFHSNALVASDTLILDWAGFIADEEGPDNNLSMDLTVQPNPSNGSVHVELSLDRPEDVSVAVYDVRGRQISVLNRGAMPPGQYTFTWDGADVAPGIYVIRAITDEASMTRSVTITR